MTTTKIQSGTKIIFTPTNREFSLVTVTDKKVSWYVGNEFKSGTGKNTLKMTCTSMKSFLKGVKSGDYKIK